MHQHYDSATKTNVNTDEEGIVRGLMPEQPFVFRCYHGPGRRPGVPRAAR